MGDIALRAAFWSHAAASQLAPTATGRAPPVTKPKKRPPAVAIVAGEPTASSDASTAAASVGPSGIGVRSSARRSSAAGAGATARSGSVARYSRARRAARLQGIARDRARLRRAHARMIQAKRSPLAGRGRRGRHRLRLALGRQT